MALRLASPAFAGGSEIPKKYGYKNGNASPPLEISGVPAECRSLALIMDDPDALPAVGKVWVHWVAWNIPPETARMPESSIPDSCMEGVSDFGKAGYGGPAPPDGRHTYVFTLYALDRMLAIPPGSAKAVLEDAMKNHVIEDATLTGTFAP